MENIVLFYDNLEYFTAIWNNLLSFGIVCCHSVYLLRFGMFDQEKSGSPDQIRRKMFIVSARRERSVFIIAQRIQ
jgi:hypothetical protein